MPLGLSGTVFVALGLTLLLLHHIWFLYIRPWQCSSPHTFARHQPLCWAPYPPPAKKSRMNSVDDGSSMPSWPKETWSWSSRSALPFPEHKTGFGEPQHLEHDLIRSLMTSRARGIHLAAFLDQTCEDDRLVGFNKGVLHDLLSKAPCLSLWFACPLTTCEQCEHRSYYRTPIVPTLNALFLSYNKS